MRSLKSYQEDIARCVRCGACRSSCPTFGVLRDEPSCARGKMSLIDSWIQGEIGLSDKVIKHLSECVLCGACEQSCSNNVPVPDIIMAARREIVKQNGLPFLTSLIMKTLRNPAGIMKKGVKLASFFQKFILAFSSTGEGCRRRIPLPYIQDERLVPPLAKNSFLDLIKKEDLSKFNTLHAGNGREIRVGFFAGCLINYILPDIGLSSLKVLKELGAIVIIPQGQTCCGMPALTVGDVEDARALVLKNLEVFNIEKLDYITTACATCSDCLKRKFPEILESEGPDVKQRVEAFASKVRDITDLIVNELGIQTLLPYGEDTKEKGPLVTYHDPCHLRRGLGIKDEPRELIELAGFSRKEMKRPCKCCGLGGSFNITNYELSMEINRSKAEDIKGTGAEIVATSCPGCMVQLRDGLHRIGANTRVRHVIELINERLEREDERKQKENSLHVGLPAVSCRESQ